MRDLQVSVADVAVARLDAVGMVIAVACGSLFICPRPEPFTQLGNTSLAGCGSIARGLEYLSRRVDSVLALVGVLTAKIR